MADQPVHPAITAKNLALSNTTALDVVALEREAAAIVVMKAASPSRPDLGILSTRHSAINTGLKNHA